MAAKPELSAERARELISQVNASDRDKARQAIHGGVQMAEANWIEAPLIAEALAQELIALARTSQRNSSIAAYLRELADVLDTQRDLH